MELHGYAYAFFGGPDLSSFGKDTLSGWARVAFERFAYDGIGGKGPGESAVYRKIAARVAPLGWLDNGYPWLTWAENGRIKINTKAAAELRRERFTCGGGADHAHAAAASAVLLVLDALDDNRLDRT